MNDVDPVAPATSFARAFAERAYPLWHATQAARVNNVAGLEPPATGHWTNNPHADDWRRTWFEIQKKWSSETGCPDGVFRAFNIDARLNAAYVVLGLLYGEGEFGRTIDIATRAGQDSDCNPATAAGILGTAFGYSGIPEEWKRGLAAVESTDFAYTSTSLAEAYELSYEHALQVIRRAGGPVLERRVVTAAGRPEVRPCGGRA